MSSIQESPNTPSRFDSRPFLVGRGREITYGLAGATALLLIIPIWMVVKYGFRDALGPVFIWSVALVLTTGVLALIHSLAAPSGSVTESQKYRLEFMTLGGLVGFFTAVLGFLLPFTTFRETIGGGFTEWRKHPVDLLWTGLAILGGLVLVFVSLLLTKGEERTNQSQRRLLYGYNTVLTTILLAGILLLVNVLSFVKIGPFRVLSQTFDWTSARIYTLSDSSKNILANLQEPVKVYIMLTSGESQEVETLLQNCRAVNDRVSWQTLLRDYDRRQIAELVKKYALPDADGLLVIYGPEDGPGKKNEFIRDSDLFSFSSSPDGSESLFKGESALMGALVRLSEGKPKVVYFTQDNGEQDVNNRDRSKLDEGIGGLYDRLQSRGNYELRELKMDFQFKKIPDDADVVVMVRPRKVPANGVAALRDYLKGSGAKKGKLMVLFDVVREGDRMAATGLEGLMEEFGVRVGNDRLITLDQSRAPQPTNLLVQANEKSQNPVARAFSRSDAVVPFFMMDARPVEPLPTNPGAPATHNAEVLLQTLRGDPIFPEADLSKDPAVLASSLRKPENFQEAVRRISKQPVPVAVTVSEGANLPPIPGHPPVGQNSKPLLVVYGDATWVTNRILLSQFGDDNFDIFASSLSWLEERSDLGAQVEDKERKKYSLNVPNDVLVRIKLLPLGLMLLGVLFVGGGVWVVRRR